VTDFMKKPCDSCPFRRDVKPFLTNGRAEELAYHTENPYNTFPCHKTTEYDDDDDDDAYSGGGRMITQRTKECAGFLSMQVNNSGLEVEGFEPSNLVYEDSYDMIMSYEEANEKQTSS
jgi:hypothetical protein